MFAASSTSAEIVSEGFARRILPSSRRLTSSFGCGESTRHGVKSLGTVVLHRIISGERFKGEVRLGGVE